MKLIEAGRFLGAAVLVGTLAACGGSKNSEKDITFDLSVDCTNNPKSLREVPTPKIEMILRAHQEIRIGDRIVRGLGSSGVAVDNENESFVLTPRPEVELFIGQIRKGVAAKIIVKSDTQAQEGVNLTIQLFCPKG